MSKKGVVFTILSALIYGFTPILCTITYGMGNNAVTLTFFRNFFCLPILAIIMLIKKIDFKLTLHEIKSIILVGINGSVVATLLLYSSYSYVDVGTATTLHFLYPIFVTLIYKFYYRGTITRNQVIALVLSGIGSACFIDTKSLGKIQGVVMALLSGVAFAVYLVLIEKKKLSQMNGFKLSFYLALTVTVIFFTINLFTKSIMLNQPIESYGLMLAVSILASFIAVVFLKEGIRLIGSAHASVFSLFEPISSVVFGLIFLNESITFIKLIGCGFIVLGIVALANRNSSKSRINFKKNR